MTAFKQKWEVEPHGELVQLDDNLLTVEGEIVMPLGNFPRRMTVAALPEGGTAIWSPIALREPEMKRIEALGAPKWLIVPGVAHRLDVRIWKERYPQVKLLCAPGAREKVEEAVPVDETEDPFGGPNISFETVPGTKNCEAAMLVRGPSSGLTLIVNDLVANVRHPHGVGAQVMARLFGFGVKEARMPRAGKWFFVDDAPALALRLRHWARMPDLMRLIPSHGEILEAPRDTLVRIAEDLDAQHVAA